MSETTWERLGAASGIGFVVLFLVGAFVFDAGEPPALEEATATQLRVYLVDNLTTLQAQALAFALAFLLLAFAFGIAVSVAAVALDELVFRRYTRSSDFVRLLLLGVLENFGYRQLVAYWRVRGVLSALLGRRGWGEMQRRGFSRGTGKDDVADAPAAR